MLLATNNRSWEWDWKPVSVSTKGLTIHNHSATGAGTALGMVLVRRCQLLKLVSRESDSYSFAGLTSSPTVHRPTQNSDDPKSQAVHDLGKQVVASCLPGDCYDTRKQQYADLSM